MPRFDYPCPDCHAASSLHDAGCRFEGTEWQTVERNLHIAQAAINYGRARDLGAATQ